jgi:hypothetical protein
MNIAHPALPPHHQLLQQQPTERSESKIHDSSFIPFGSF